MTRLSWGRAKLLPTQYAVNSHCIMTLLSPHDHANRGRFRSSCTTFPLVVRNLILSHASHGSKAKCSQAVAIHDVRYLKLSPNPRRKSQLAVAGGDGGSIAKLIRLGQFQRAIEFPADAVGDQSGQIPSPICTLFTKSMLVAFQMFLGAPSPADRQK